MMMEWSPICWLLLICWTAGMTTAGPTAVTTASTTSPPANVNAAIKNSTAGAQNLTVDASSPPSNPPPPRAASNDSSNTDLFSLFRSAAAIDSTPRRKAQVPTYVGQNVPGPVSNAFNTFQTVMIEGGQPQEAMPQQQLWPAVGQQPMSPQQLQQMLYIQQQQQQQLLKQLPIWQQQQQLQPVGAPDTRDGMGQFAAAPPPHPNYIRYCHVNDYPWCSCIQPPLYSEDGRGNCNVGSSKMDLRVWCYVDESKGNPLQLCPDAMLSVQGPNKGRFWSRIACITP